ncbi:hypothetical protein ILYODFUR_037255 [Ilyodon furcidens]|uniref:Secreted protein n=1 Tax=Ilyodon furcidens TaxID=33524 RepID=A0ABV0TGT0_9TELE
MHLFQEMDSALQFTLLLCGFGIGATSQISKRSEEVGSGVHSKCLAGWTPYQNQNQLYCQVRTYRGLCYLFDEIGLKLR